MNMGKCTLVLAGLALAMGLNSCYFNSAGKIVDKASYKALSTTADIAQHQLIYCKNGQYYIELPRYRNEKPVKLHYSITDEKDKTPFTPTLVPNTRDMFRIPRDFAMYLAGKAKGPKRPSEMVFQRDGEEIKNSADSTMKIVRTADKYNLEHKYRSPNAPWLWTAAVFDWLCVDLPVTCVENGLAITGVVALVPFAVLADMHETGEKARKEREAAIRAQEAAARQQQQALEQARAEAVASGAAYYATCVRCGGSGIALYQVTTYREKTGYELGAEANLRATFGSSLIKPSRYTVIDESTRSEVCPDCGGCGQVLLRK